MGGQYTQRQKEYAFTLIAESGIRATARQVGQLCSAVYKKDIFNYIEVFYNRKHRYASLGNVTPAVYEEMYEINKEQAA